MFIGYGKTISASNSSLLAHFSKVLI